MARRVMNRELASRNITVLHNTKVSEVTPTSVTLTSGKSLPQDIVVWCTGARCHAVHDKFKAAGIETSKKGWISVNSSLQSRSHPNIFACGDCCQITDVDEPPPKAGVYAVRAGVHVKNNLMHYLKQEPLELFAPQRDFLRLFNLGDGNGIGFRFGIAMYGPWVYDWKDAIDRVWFMESFSKDKLPDLSTVDVMAKAEQFDAAQHVATELAPSDPAEAAKVLMKQDITWPSNQVKQIVNLMVQDEAYRMNVVQAAFSC